ncbi:hypothetical protein N7451_008794 [Penicillium sp. IBT 35674x]|nr:hypothetical protein N7451_008794 [Penicillium sp. IBT 35674x]
MTLSDGLLQTEPSGKPSRGKNQGTRRFRMNVDEVDEEHGEHEEHEEQDLSTPLVGSTRFSGTSNADMQGGVDGILPDDTPAGTEEECSNEREAIDAGA